MRMGQDEEPCACALCSEDLPEEIVDQIMLSAATQGSAMTFEEFRAWLDGLAPDMSSAV